LKSFVISVILNGFFLGVFGFSFYKRELFKYFSLKKKRKKSEKGETIFQKSTKVFLKNQNSNIQKYQFSGVLP